MSKRKTATTVFLSNVTGTVTEVHYPGKAVVVFSYKGEEERALLNNDKLLIDGQANADREKFHELVHQGSQLKFSCHSFDDTGGDRCKWFIGSAWRLHPHDLGNSPLEIIYGINATLGSVAEITPRHCIITFTNYSGEDESVLAPASRIYLGGHRVSSKQNLQNLLRVYDAVTFQAIPCEPRENPKKCKWIATLVYRGRKPQSDYEGIVEIPSAVTPTVVLGLMKQVIFDPKSVFIKGHGHIIEIVSEEFGSALISLRYNQWESLLFHRITVSLFGLKLSSQQNLKEIFKEGDKIRFIAVPAPKHGLNTRWWATQISVDTGPGILEEELPLIKKLT